MHAASTGALSEKMLPAQRQAFILDVVHERGAVSIQLLSDRLGASYSTVRRDLDELAKRGLIIRNHGGATLLPQERPLFDEPHSDGSETVNEIKRLIGIEGAKRVQDGQSVIFDSNVTVVEAARRLVEQRLRLVAVTNNIKVAAVLAHSSTVRLVVVGGTVRTGSFALTGEPGYSFLGQLHADLAIMGAHSATDGVLTDSLVDTAAMKKAMMQAARSKILLIDSWKFGGPGFCEVAPLSEFDQVITDDGLPDSESEALLRAGVKLKIVTTGASPSNAWRVTTDAKKGEDNSHS